jgi:multiple sugar transport system substrate-binding protein
MLAAAALAGCGGSGGGGGSDLPVVQVFGDAQELASYRAIAKAYEKQAGKRVRLAETPDRDTHLAKLTTGFAAKRPPDVFLLNYRNFGPFASKGVLDPVGDRVPPAGFYPAALGAFTWKGQLTCVPQSASSVVVYVNLDRFAEAGVRPPVGEWSFDRFLRTGRKLRDALLRRPADADVRPLGVDPSLIRLAPFIWASGGEVVDDVADPKSFTLNTPQARRGIDRFLSLYREALVPREVDLETKPLGDRFLDGQLAMYMSSRRETALFRGITDFEWDVAPFPHAEKAGGVLQSDAYCVARGARSAAAWDFVKFAAGPEGQRILARGGRVVPSLRSVAASPDFLAPGKAPRHAQVFVDAAEHLKRLPNTENWPRIEDAASLSFKRAFYIETTVDQAIAGIEAESKGAF